MESIKGLGRYIIMPCKSHHEIHRFLQGLIDRKIILSYTADINKTIVEEEDEKEKVVRIIKGASLTPISSIPYPSSTHPYFFQFAEDKRFYVSDEDYRSSHSSFEDEEFSYGHFKLTSLCQDARLERIGKKSYDHFDIPKELIQGTLYYHWTHEKREGKDYKKRGTLEVDVEDDIFFSILTEFLSQ